MHRIIKIIGIYFLICMGISQAYGKNETEFKPGHIVVQGKLVCLPHRNPNGPQTEECAYGLSSDSYFALDDSTSLYRNLNGIAMGERVEVEGEFIPGAHSNYQDIGLIKILRITRLDSKNSHAVGR